MLGRGRIWFTGPRIGDAGTIAEGEHTRPGWHLKRRVDDHRAAPIDVAGDPLQHRTRRSASRPDQGVGHQHLVAAEGHRVGRRGLDFGVQADLDTALAQRLGSVVAKLRTDLGQDVRARVGQHDPASV